MRLKFCLHFLLFLIIQTGVKGQWHGDPAIVNNPVSTAPYTETNPHCITDGAGGTISVWSGNGGLVAQRKTSSGAPVWSSTASPVQVLAGVSGDIYDMIPDGNGGAYISLQQYINDSTANVYIQHINNDGSLPLGVNGIKVNPANNHFNTDVKLCADPNGVIVTWGEEIRDNSTSPPTYVYAQAFAQRYDLSGVAQWGNNGMQVSIAPGFKNTPEIVSDNNGGAFIAFTDYRNTDLLTPQGYNNLDIYAQHISINGTRLWGINDLVISNESSNQSVYINFYPLPAKSMISDSAGGFLIVYAAGSNDNPVLYAQRVSGTGVILFTPAVLLSATGNAKPYLSLANDGTHGVVAGWAEWSGALNNFVHAQRVSGTGALMWGTSPVIVSPDTDEDFNRFKISMAADNSHNYIFTWRAGGFTEFNLRAQKLNNSGVFQWGATGVDICTNPQASAFAPDMAPGDSNTMIIVWRDQRNAATSSTDIYGARILPGGTLAESPARDFFTTADGNWNDPAVWTAKQVPPPGINVVIHNKISANINATCNSLTIEKPGELTVNTGIHITVLH